MNRQIRQVAVLVICMFAALALSLTSIQGFARPALWESSSGYGDLTSDSRNVRTVYNEYGRDRGPILVAGEAVAASEESDDAYQYQRVYSQGELYAPVTGYFSTVFASMTGLERMENEMLNGTSPSLFSSRIQSLFTGTQPQGGALELTIDPEIQQAAWDALDGREGSVVALNPSTGEILALVSSPSYDPNLLASHDSETANEAWDALLEDDSDPLTNRAINGDLYPPGSTFKIITAAAALRTLDYTVDTEVDAPDSLTLPGTTHELTNYAGESCGNGTVTFAYAFAHSCNTPFAQLSMDVGEEALTSEAQAWGFDSDLSIPLTVTNSTFPATDSDAELAMAGIGQQSVRSTPLMMAMVAATVANDGEQMRPYLIAQTLDADLNVVSSTTPSVLRTPISSTMANELTSMMQGVVSEGTATNAQVSGVSVAGKTGTAQTGSDEGGPITWFVGFAGTDIDNPTIALAVVLDGGSQASSSDTGGTTAAPIAATVIDAAVDQ